MSELRLPLTAALAVLAATVVLSPAFQTAEYFWPCTGAVLTVAVGGFAARRLGLPHVLVAPVTLALLAGFLTLVYARAEAVFFVIPGPAAIAELRALAETGIADIQRFAAPVRAYPGIVALTAAGVGLVAVFVDMLACTYRRVALAGLPLLVLYCVPAGIVAGGVGWLPFMIGATGYLALLLSDSGERVRRWGRPVGRSVGDRAAARRYVGEVDTTALHQVGRRVGAAAVGVAVVVPALLPNFSDGVFGWGGRGFGAGDGARTVNVVNPIVDLRRDLIRPRETNLIQYQTDDPDPGYLRMATLDTFTGETWVPARLKATDEQDVENGLPKPPGLSKQVDARTHEWTIEIGGLRDARLPLPYPVAKVEAEGQWLYDEPTRNVFSYRNDTRGLHYDVVSLDLDYTADRLRRSLPAASISGSTMYTKLPDDLPPLVRRHTTRLTTGARSDYDAALAIQHWLRTEFRYSLEIEPGNSSSALVDFLTDRSGYCEQFAATMAVMARVAGIPSRVNVGFTPGQQISDDTWLVSTHDAHAWPELYFSGVGWVPFEPTPRSDGTTPPPSYADADELPEVAGTGPAGESSGPGTNNNPRTANEPRRPLDPRLAGGRLQPGPAGRANGGVAPTDDGLGTLPLFLLASAVVVALSPAMVRVLLRRHRSRRIDATADGVAAAWAELIDTAWDFGVRPSASQTPRQLEAKVLAEGPLEGRAERALSRLTRVCERSRFAARIGPVGDVRADLAAVRRGLAARAVRTARLRALLVPPSTRAALTWIAERVADALDLVDTSAAWLRIAVRTGAARLQGRIARVRP